MGFGNSNERGGADESIEDEPSSAKEGTSPTNEEEKDELESENGDVSGRAGESSSGGKAKRSRSRRATKVKEEEDDGPSPAKKRKRLSTLFASSPADMSSCRACHQRKPSSNASDHFSRRQ